MPLITGPHVPLTALKFLGGVDLNMAHECIPKSRRCRQTVNTTTVRSSCNEPLSLGELIEPPPVGNSSILIVWSHRLVCDSQYSGVPQLFKYATD